LPREDSGISPGLEEHQSHGGTSRGLRVGTAYWFDIGVAAETDGTANVFDLSIQIIED
jgi:hypothetical protein